MRKEDNILFPVLEFWLTFTAMSNVGTSDFARYYENGIPIHLLHSRQIVQGRETVGERFPDLNAGDLKEILAEPGVLINIVLSEPSRKISDSFIVAEKGLGIDRTIRKTFYIPDPDVRGVLTKLCIRKQLQLPSKDDSIVVANRQIGFQRVVLSIQSVTSDFSFDD